MAIDLRGRGQSADAPGPYGMRRHADDVAVVIERFSAAPAVIAGHCPRGQLEIEVHSVGSQVQREAGRGKQGCGGAGPLHAGGGRDARREGLARQAAAG